MSRKLATLVSARQSARALRSVGGWGENAEKRGWLGKPDVLYFDSRGKKGILPVDTERYKADFKLYGDMTSTSNFHDAQKRGAVPPYIWFDWGPIISSNVGSRGTTIGRKQTHPHADGGVLTAYAAIMIPDSQGQLKRWNLTVFIGMKWLQPYPTTAYQWVASPTFILEQGRTRKRMWVGLGKYKYPSKKDKSYLNLDSMGEEYPFSPKKLKAARWSAHHRTTTPHEILPYAMGWAEEFLSLAPSIKLGAALQNPKGNTNSLMSARRRYEELGKRLSRSADVRGQGRALRRSMKAERRSLEREWGSGISKRKKPYKKKEKAVENPSSWYLGGQKQGLRGMQYYYLNRVKPYVLYLSTREPKESGKPNKINLEVKRAYPGPDAETEIRMGKLTPKEWWTSLDPQRPTRWRGGSLTLEPIANKRFYYKGHLTSLKYQALDWADSVIFTPSERLGLL